MRRRDRLGGRLCLAGVSNGTAADASLAGVSSSMAANASLLEEAGKAESVAKTDSASFCDAPIR